LDWWTDFQKYAEALGKNKNIPSVVIEHIIAAKRLFTILNEHREELDSFSSKDVDTLSKKSKQLLTEVLSLELHVTIPKVQTFFHQFALTIESGLSELWLLQEQKVNRIDAKHLDFVPETWKPITERLQKIRIQSENLGKEFLVLESKYRELSVTKLPQGVQSESKSDSAPELTDFMSIVDLWLKHRYGLEYSIRVLHQNLNPELIRQIGGGMPLKFRVESQESPHLFKALIAKSSHVSKLDQTILDVISRTPDCQNRQQWNDFALQEKKIASFVQEHSEPGQQLEFDDDPISRIAAKIYQRFLRIMESLQPLQEWAINLIDQTPLQDLEKTIEEVKPEDCRTLLRYKIQSILPGINDDHYRAKQENARSMRSIRTTMLINSNTRKFQEAFEEMSPSFKSLLAFKLWLRKTLVNILRNNQGPVKSLGGTRQFQEPTINVPINLTLGEENIKHYFVDEVDITSAKGGAQRSSKGESWVKIITSEKLHRIIKKDFFSIIYDLCQENLNPAFEKLGLAPIDFKNQFIPEINERIEDKLRIDQIRSGMLGTTISSIHTFTENHDFHTLFRRYFQVAAYNQIQYPYREKFNLLADELSQANPTMLQIKFRKILTVQYQVEDQISKLSGTSILTGTSILMEHKKYKLLRLEKRILKEKQNL